MNLYIMRHGPAEDVAPSGRDADRSLTRTGRERVARVVDALWERGEVPRRVVTSPYARAEQTASLVAERAGVEVERSAELAPGKRVADFARRLAASPEGDGVLLVGHEPDLSSLVETLTGSWSGGFEKAMVVALCFEAEGTTVRAVLEPKGPSWR